MSVSVDPEVIESLKMLASEDDPDFLKLLIETYLEDAQALYQQLVDASQSGDSNLACRFAHTLKSSSANMGAIPLANYAELVEESLRTGTDLQALVDPIQKMGEELKLVVNYLRKELHGTGL
ncbi:MAG: Hpt domain-containing protein [Myxococcota bacterium]|nr:Hpt domain-containing protein [Myxococcota bacterium]